MMSTRTLCLLFFAGILPYFIPYVAPAQTNIDALTAYSDNPLKNVVAPDILNYATLEAHDSKTYGFDKDEYGNFISLTVTSDQLVQHNGVSTEIAIDYPFNEGDTVRYSWRMRLGRGFSPDPANRWYLLARWNDQANTKIGERPEDFLVYNPTLLFGYKRLDSKDTISISSGVPDLITAGSFGIKRDQWVKFTVEVTWSRSDKGRAAIFINDAKLPEREISGPNMYGRYHNKFRLGIFRSAEIKNTSTIHIGDVKVERVMAPAN